MHQNLLDLPREAVTACHAVRWSPGGCKVIRMPLRQIIIIVYYATEAAHTDIYRV